MTLPRFFSRVADAISPVANLDRDALADHLGNVVLNIHNDHRAGPERDEATLLAVNIAARLYPRLVLHGDPAWTARAAALATAINPAAALTRLDLDQDGPQGAPADVDQHAVHLRWTGPGTADTVVIAANGWNVLIDPEASADINSDVHPLTTAAAACLGMAEVFRTVFAEALAERGRRGRQPGGFNLITCASPTDETPVQGLSELLPPATLIGAGAIGQACLWALIQTGATLTLNVVDPEPITLSNLQRYLLTDDGSVDKPKTALASTAAAGSAVTVVEVATPWGADDRTGPGTSIALVALDSAEDRIAVAAALPELAYNAWTQPNDIGWSRHENFGVEPCLACLYYPDRPRLSEHELIAAAINQHPLRALTYLILNIPVGAPLPVVAGIPELPPPPEAQIWHQRAILQDLIDLGMLPPEQAEVWANKLIGELYRDGVCAGGLIRLPGSDQPEAAIVPLAHQSALAGIMLAIEFYAAHQPTLREHRRSAVEARLDVLRGLPQTLTRPRQNTAGCICSDPLYTTPE